MLESLVKHHKLVDGVRSEQRFLVGYGGRAFVHACVFFFLPLMQPTCIGILDIIPRGIM